MTRPDCVPVQDDLADLVAGDSGAIARHSEHLASCDDCRDARHEASRLVGLIPYAGSDHLLAADLVERVLIAAGNDPVAQPAPQAAQAAQAAAPKSAARHDAAIPITSAPRARARMWVAIGATAAVAAGGIGVYAFTRGDSQEATQTAVAGGPIGTVKTIDRAAKGQGDGLSIREGKGWRPLRANEAVAAGAELRTDERTRAAVELTDGTRFVLDHRTSLVFDRAEARHSRLTAVRIVADVVHVEARPAMIDTPSGHIDVVGTRFAVTATDALTVVQVVRGAVVLTTAAGTKDDVRAGEEGVIDHGALAVNAAPGLAREVEWSELTPCLLYTSPSPRDGLLSRMPSSA